MEKKLLNKKLQLNKETIAILDKEQQSQILGGEIPTKTCDSIVATCPTFVDACHPATYTCPPEVIKTEKGATCVYTKGVCESIGTCTVTYYATCQ